MLYDASGRPAQPETQQPARTVEIARSFSFKLNLGNYQSADFFCSQKASCSADMAEEVSADLYEFCVDQVQQAIKDFQERQARKSAQRSNAA